MENEQGVITGGIRDWKGLLRDRSPKVKMQVFTALLVLSTAMTFTQYGFIGIGANGDYLCYVLGLLGPLTAVALLLGKGSGALFGAISGAVLYIHAHLQPLDLFEHSFVSSLSSVVLYGCMGFLLGVAFALALRKNPTGVRRAAYLAIACAGMSVIVTFAFFSNGVLAISTSSAPFFRSAFDQATASAGLMQAAGVMRGLEIQVLFDAVLMACVCVATDVILRWQQKTMGDASVRITFGGQLLTITILVFCIVQAVSFVVTTRNAETQSLDKMRVELQYLNGELNNAILHKEKIAATLAPYHLNDEVIGELTSSSGVEDILEGYNLGDGTIIVFHGNKILCSYNEAYPVGASMDELFDTRQTGTLEELAETGRLQEMIYSTKKAGGDVSRMNFSDVQLGYMYARKSGDYYLLMAMPSSMVFANRWAIVSWTSVMAFVLLVSMYVFATRLLSKDVVSPIDRTNASLAKITSGNLGEVVRENDSREFSSLSAGINETVEALKGLIADAERRNENDLVIAKRIQESALPRTFPPFPEIGTFDIFASMDAAKEVGGDFYDYFLIDDRTLGLLIADVSGKGIPGALFMMAAKAMIENYLSTGMEPAEAIASANRRLCANNDAGMFVTVWAATLDWQTGHLTYVNAGHNFPLLRHGQGGSWEWLKAKCGLFLGTFEMAKYRQETLTLKPGDELVLYTDGVNEAFNPDEEEYGNDRLEAFLAAHADVHPRELVRSLRSDVARWADGAEQSDDVTILALEYGVAPEVTGSITVPATLEHLTEAMEFVTGELERRLCPVGAQNKVEIALEELFVNVCRYAYADQEGPGEVTVSYAYGTKPSSITVELRDTGVPFDPVEMDDPTKPSSIQEARIGGLGILMVRRSMDDFAYIRDDDANVVVFRKGW